VAKSDILHVLGKRKDDVKKSTVKPTVPGPNPVAVPGPLATTASAANTSPPPKNQKKKKVSKKPKVSINSELMSEEVIDAHDEPVEEDEEIEVEMGGGGPLNASTFEVDEYDENEGDGASHSISNSHHIGSSISSHNTHDYDPDAREMESNEEEEDDEDDDDNDEKGSERRRLQKLQRKQQQQQQQQQQQKQQKQKKKAVRPLSQLKRKTPPPRDQDEAPREVTKRSRKEANIIDPQIRGNGNTMEVPHPHSDEESNHSMDVGDYIDPMNLDPTPTLPVIPPPAPPLTPPLSFQSIPFTPAPLTPLFPPLQSQQSNSAMPSLSLGSFGSLGSQSSAGDIYESMDLGMQRSPSGSGVVVGGNLSFPAPAPASAATAPAPAPAFATPVSLPPPASAPAPTSAPLPVPASTPAYTAAPPPLQKVLSHLLLSPSTSISTTSFTPAPPPPPPPPPTTPTSAITPANNNHNNPTLLSSLRSISAARLFYDIVRKQTAVETETVLETLAHQFKIQVDDFFPTLIRNMWQPHCFSVATLDKIPAVSATTFSFLACLASAAYETSISLADNLWGSCLSMTDTFHVEDAPRSLRDNLLIADTFNRIGMYFGSLGNNAFASRYLALAKAKLALVKPQRSSDKVHYDFIYENILWMSMVYVNDTTEANTVFNTAEAWEQGKNRDRLIIYVNFFTLLSMSYMHLYQEPAEYNVTYFESSAMNDVIRTRILEQSTELKSFVVQAGHRNIKDGRYSYQDLIDEVNILLPHPFLLLFLFLPLSPPFVFLIWSGLFFFHFVLINRPFEHLTSGQEITSLRLAPFC
jgi:hypothetical protein